MTGMKRKLTGIKLEPELDTKFRVETSFSHLNILKEETTSDSECEDHPYSKAKRSKMYNKQLQNDSRLKWHYNDDHETKLNLGLYVRNRNRNGTGSTSKKAIMSRINRLKKKEYILGLETKNKELESENEMLKDLLKRRVEEIENLKRETVNLRSVIRNSTEIGSLLKCIHENTSLQISSSILENYSSHSQSSSRPSSSIKLPDSADRSNALSAIKEEAFAAAILWGMALHTFCQPYKIIDNALLKHHIDSTFSAIVSLRSLKNSSDHLNEGLMLV